MVNKVDRRCCHIMSTWLCRDKITTGRNWHHRLHWRVGIRVEGIRSLIIRGVKEDITALIIIIHHKIRLGTRYLHITSIRDRTTAIIITINSIHSLTTITTITITNNLPKPLLLITNLSQLYTQHRKAIILSRHQNKQLNNNNNQR